MANSRRGPHVADRRMEERRDVFNIGILRTLAETYNLHKKKENHVGMYRKHMTTVKPQLSLRRVHTPSRFDMEMRFLPEVP